MDLNELLQHFNHGDTVGEDPEVIELMRYYSRQAQKITMEINTKYHEPEELAELFSQLIGKPVGEKFGLFPPFYTDFGKNITIGKNVNKIKASAFYGNSKGKSLTIILKTAKLTTSSKFKKFLKGTKAKKVTIKVSVGSSAKNKKTLKAYKKIFTKTNCGVKVTLK